MRKTVIIITILLSFVALFAFCAIKTSRPVEVVNKAPTAYLCEGSVMIDDSGQAIYDAPQCKGGR